MKEELGRRATDPEQAEPGEGAPEAGTTVQIRVEAGGLAHQVTVTHREPHVARSMALGLLRLLSGRDGGLGG